MVEVRDIAPNAVDRESMEQREYRWAFLIYGNPGVGKTHFSLTMPDPIAFIDTEGKGHAIFDKFPDKDIIPWEVRNYDEAKVALSEALDVLHAHHNETGELGTIVVDSMGNMWDWAQQKHLEKAYPGKDPGDVNFKSALQGGQDWQVIKRYHNQSFRELMVNSPFHLCWTAQSNEDYGAVLKGEASEPPKKPDGEKNNIYKASEMIHLFQGTDGRPMGNLKKSALTRVRFGKMLWPTFDKVSETIEMLVDAEKSDEPTNLDELEKELEVDLFTGDPDIVYRTQDED